MAAHMQIMKMVELLDEKMRLLERMLKYTQEQSQAITEDDAEDLGRLVDRKQKIIEKINTIDGDFEEAFDSLKRGMEIASLSELQAKEVEGAEKLKDSAEKTVSVIKKIKVMEEENQSKARRLLDAFGERIKKISMGKKLNSVYKPPSAGVPPYFMDKKK